ncbi:Rieske (2Fe-2S) protein [Pseudomonas sp. SbOxS1]|uniref:Rieske (2Fe-2S) protein n=1 Tax=Pseudomonas sp. SbOxS1 TaxID=2723884 RepID=UPI0034D23C1D
MLCHINALIEGTARGFDPHGIGQDSVVVILHEQQVFAYRNACPHLDTPLAWRKDAYLNAAQDRIVCFAHGALFEIRTGRCVLGPCLGQSLHVLQVIVDDDGMIHLQ